MFTTLFRRFPTSKRIFGATLALVVSFSFFPLAFANDDTDSTPEDLQVWAPITLEARWSHKWRTLFEVQNRFSDNASEWTLARIRPSMVYDVNKRLSLFVGYAYNPEQNGTNHENRIWQQAIWTTPVGKGNLSQRVRTEQRLISGVDSTIHRARYQALYSRPLGKSPWSGVVSQELIFNLNNADGVESGFDQTRSFVGIRRQLGEKKQTTLETGYQLVWDNPGRQNDAIIHALLFRLLFRVWDTTQPSSTPDSEPKHILLPEESS